MSAWGKKMTMADFLNSPPNQAINQNLTSTSGLQENTLPSESLNPVINNRLPYSVRATKKGGVPCAVESRKHHKVVVLSNVEGDVSALLSALQRALGTGGVIKGKTVEIQGEHHLDKVRKFVLNSDCVVGASKAVKAEAAAASSKAKKGGNKTGGGKVGGAPENATSSSSKTVNRKPVDSTVILDAKAVKAMKPADLKSHLSARQLSIQGNKKELMARLLGSNKQS